MKTILAACLLSTAWIALPAQDPEDAETAAIERATLDYIEAIYYGKPELMRRSVHPQVHKVGYRSSEDEDFPVRPMTYDKLIGLAEEWSDGRTIPDDAPKDVEVLDRFHDIATVKLIASWGVDYMLLARSAGRWKIVQVLYQSNPKKD